MLKKNPHAWYALLVCLIPCVTALALLGLQYGIGPRALLYAVAQGAGVFALLGLVFGSGLILVASTQTKGRWDHKITLAVLFLLTGGAGLYLFRHNL